MTLKDSIYFESETVTDYIGQFMTLTKQESKGIAVTETLVAPLQLGVTQYSGMSQDLLP